MNALRETNNVSWGSVAFTFAGFDFPRPRAALGRDPHPTVYFPKPNSTERCFYLSDSHKEYGLRWEYASYSPGRRTPVGIRCEDLSPVYPIVFRLPRRRGFLPGWTYGANMLACIDYSQSFDTLADAALCADSMARNQAEADYEHLQELDTE